MTTTIEKKQRKPAPKHWYRMHVGECPVCGRDASYRERVEGPPPVKHEDRYHALSHQETYCHCMEG
jgi:rRNA maturation protein Nop10